MLLQEGADFSIEDIRALEVVRVSRGRDTLEARARHVPVHRLRLLGPDEAVLVAGEEHGGYARRGVALDRRRQALEPIAEVGSERRVQPGDLRVEERA